MNNWKTTLFGAIPILLPILQHFFPTLIPAGSNIESWIDKAAYLFLGIHAVDNVSKSNSSTGTGSIIPALIAMFGLTGLLMMSSCNSSLHLSTVPCPNADSVTITVNDSKPFKLYKCNDTTHTQLKNWVFDHLK